MDEPYAKNRPLRASPAPSKEELRKAVEACKRRGLIRGPDQGPTPASEREKRAAASAPSTEPPAPLKPVCPAQDVDGIQFAFLDVTPEIAKEWLSRNRGNRPLREATVASYARDMRNGDWLTNHQGIAFYTDGGLHDGQHRLSAVVVAGVTVRLLVSQGWPRKRANRLVGTADTVDVGAGRSLTDILRLQHDCESPRVVTSACRSILALAVGMKRAHKTSVAVILATAAEFAEALRWMFTHVPRDRGIRQAQVIGALTLLRAGASDVPAFEVFANRLYTGANLDDTHPILSLRNYLLSDAAKLDAAANKQTVAFTVLTHFVAYMAAQPLTRNTISKESVDRILEANRERLDRIRALFDPSPKN